MSVEPPNLNHMDDELRELWQDQKLEGEKMSIEEIRNKARTFERKIRIRNLIEYIAGVVVFVAFGREMLTAPNGIMAAGCGLVLLGTAYVIYTLHTRGSAQSVPDEMGRETFLDFYRTSLERQRNLVVNVRNWYLLPFAPGVILIFIGAAVRDGVLLNPARTPEQLRDGVFKVVFAIFVVGIFFAVAALNKRVARKLQSQIDELKQ